jgi:flagellar protein FliS
MTNKATRAYGDINAETSVSDARPEYLILLVFEKLLDHLVTAEKQLQAGELATESFNKSLDIFRMGLMPALDFERGGEIAQNLGNLYDWSVRHLLKAQLNKDPKMVREVYGVLTPIYEAWQGVSSPQAAPV